MIKVNEVVAHLITAYFSVLVARPRGPGCCTDEPGTGEGGKPFFLHWPKNSLSALIPQISVGNGHALLWCMMVVTWPAWAAFHPSQPSPPPPTKADGQNARYSRPLWGKLTNLIMVGPELSVFPTIRTHLRILRNWIKVALKMSKFLSFNFYFVASTAENEAQEKIICL